MHGLRCRIPIPMRLSFLGVFSSCTFFISHLLLFVRRIQRQILVKGTTVNSPLSPNALNSVGVFPSCAYIHWVPYPNALILILRILLMRSMN
jgi:hypothetical protein